MIRKYLAALAMVGAASVAQAQSCSQPADVQAAASSLAQMTNSVRQQAGRGALQGNRDLSEAAQVLACDIARTGQISHQSSSGQSPMERARQAGYRGCVVAENLAWGFPRPATIIDGWLNSPGHNRNLLDARMADFGIGIAQGAQGPIWVMIYARGC